MFQRIGLLLTVTVIMYYKVKWYPILYYHEVAFLLYILDGKLASQKVEWFAKQCYWRYFKFMVLSGFIQAHTLYSSYMKGCIEHKCYVYTSSAQYSM